MTLTIVQESTTYDQWGNPTTSTTETNYEIDSRDFQPYAHGGLSDSANITDEGLLKHRFRKLFLKDTLKDLSIDAGQVVKIDGKEYKIAEIQEYEKHKEAILHAME